VKSQDCGVIARYYHFINIAVIAISRVCPRARATLTAVTAEIVRWLSCAALIYAASTRMRQQALRWELQLERESEEEPSP